MFVHILKELNQTLAGEIRQQNNWKRQRNNSIWNYFDEWEGIVNYQYNDNLRQGSE